MADVTICDRCGKRLGDKISTFATKPVLNRTSIVVELFRKWPGFSGTHRESTHEFDLCDNCTNEFYKFLENKE